MDQLITQNKLNQYSEKIELKNSGFENDLQNLNDKVERLKSKNTELYDLLRKQRPTTPIRLADPDIGSIKEKQK